MVKTMAKLRMAHASTHGARKPPGPKISFLEVGENQCIEKERKLHGLGLVHAATTKRWL